jgi:hypothetical protein
MNLTKRNRKRTIIIPFIKVNRISNEISAKLIPEIPFIEERPIKINIATRS